MFGYIFWSDLALYKNLLCYEGGYHKRFCFTAEYSETKTYVDHAIDVSIIPPPLAKGCYINIWYNSRWIQTLIIEKDSLSAVKSATKGWNIMPFNHYVMSNNVHSSNHYRIFNREFLGNSTSKSGIRLHILM